MKNLKLLTISIIALAIVSFSPKSSDNNDKEIIGTWVKQTEQQSSEKSIADNIIQIDFKKNLTAKVKVTDSVGTRVITGKWSYEKTENYENAVESTVNKLFGQSFKPSVILEYLRNGKGLNIIGFSQEQTENGLILKIGNVVFKKK